MRRLCCTARARLQSAERAGVTLLPQMRAIEPLATQQRPDLTRPVHASASATIDSLYFAVYFRRFAFTASSGSGTPAATGQHVRSRPQAQ
jgi:hypothetical protein